MQNPPLVTWIYSPCYSISIKVEGEESPAHVSQEGRLGFEDNTLDNILIWKHYFFRGSSVSSYARYI